MSRLLKRIELIANISIIVVAIVICAALARRFLFKTPAPQSDPSGIAVGTKFNLPDEDWARNGKTLVLALSTNCKYCSASAGFYQRLASVAKENTKLVAVLPQATDQSRIYLSGLKVAIEDVKQASPNSFGVTATPTLILVNKAGIVTNSWVGQLAPDKETEVLAQLR
jgi:thioredoxin-related protein